MKKETTTDSIEDEMALGHRFEFGKNWSRFLSVINDARIVEAEKSLREMLDVRDLRRKRFLDIGSGSGLFSLAARRLGAVVHSFDYDPSSVACTRELKRRYFPDDKDWTIEEGSVLDVEYMKSLGKFDVVYSWGVLHHTGAMWSSLENAIVPVAKDGKLYISIYNDQGFQSVLWRKVKRFYNSGRAAGYLTVALFVPLFVVGLGAFDLLRLLNPVVRYSAYQKARGMSVVHDWLDWLGGYPFEVAKPEEVFDFLKERGFVLIRLKTCGGKLGCNEFVFSKP